MFGNFRQDHGNALSSYLFTSPAFLSADHCKRRLTFAELEPSPFLSPSSSPVLPMLAPDPAQDVAMDTDRLSRYLTLMGRLFPNYSALSLYHQLQAYGFDLLVAMEALLEARDSSVRMTGLVPAFNWGSQSVACPGTVCATSIEKAISL